MSGHSKWSTIKRKKGANDSKRGKMFSKLIKEITVAAKEGGSGDPDSNPRLRLAIQNAKGANMPKDNIERAINKGIGTDAESYNESTFEGYAPNGVAVVVECLTDNHNRTVSSVRATFSKYNGSLGTTGSLDFIFDRKGVFTFPASEDFDQEEFELAHQKIVIQALKDFLPDEIIQKSKHGFGLPFGMWSLSHPPLRDLVNNSLEQFGSRGILREKYIQELQRQHREVHPTYFGKMVWVILMLEQWLQAHQ